MNPNLNAFEIPRTQDPEVEEDDDDAILLLGGTQQGKQLPKAQAAPKPIPKATAARSK
jgi:hypothetical protein